MTTLLALDHVSCAYLDGRATRTVLDDISLVVDRGRFVALTGPSGSGKSTLINLACGLVAPTGGTITIDGATPPTWGRGWWAERRRRDLGVVHQRHSLMAGLTVVQNVALPLELDGERQATAAGRAMEALEAVGATDLADQPATALSIGQQQLVAIARGIVGTRPLLLADEPTASLDSVAADRIVRLLADLSRDGRGVLMVTHDSRLASWADEVVSMRDGHIVDRVDADTTPSNPRRA